MSSSALYGFDLGEELRGYRFKSQTDRNLTINAELEDMALDHRGYMLIYIIGYDIIRVTESGIQKMSSGGKA